MYFSDYQCQLNLDLIGYTLLLVHTAITEERLSNIISQMYASGPTVKLLMCCVQHDCSDVGTKLTAYLKYTSLKPFS